jgi:hypothetical protein
LVHTGGNASRTAETQIYLYAAILSQACNLGATTMAQVAELSYLRSCTIIDKPN